MNSPEFLQQMSNMMSNPAIMEQIIASNPQLQAMGPQVREAFQSEQFRSLLFVSFLLCFTLASFTNDCTRVLFIDTPPGNSSDPESLQTMLRMSSMMQGAMPGGMGGGGMGGGMFGSAPSFPAPGTPGGASATGTTLGSTPVTGTTPGSPGVGTGAANPLGMFGNPAMMQQMQQMFGGGGGGLGGGLGSFGGMGGFGAPAAPTDSRPPEERFQVQLQVSTFSLQRQTSCLIDSK